MKFGLISFVLACVVLALGLMFPWSKTIVILGLCYGLASLGVALPARSGQVSFGHAMFACVEGIFGDIEAEWQRTVKMLRAITQTTTFLEDNPALARSIRNRFPYLDPLNHLQIDLLRRYRAGQTDERTKRAIHLTINGLAAGLRNSG